MKLPLLLSQFLREHQKLRLPGIGSFYASAATVTGDANSPQPALNIRYEYAAVKDADDQLIDFIKQKTGKIKPLALADLGSYIESGLQLLNIGKPFYIEGIGTIVKTREGRYDFVVRELAATHEETTNERAERTEHSDKKRSIFDDEKYIPSSNPWQKIIVAALILGGLAIVVLGGYYLYTQNNDNASVHESVTPLIDSSSHKQDTLSVPRADSTQAIASYTSAQSAGAYKFILETTTSKNRALRRFNQLKSYMLPIKIDTSNSTALKLYFLIPSTPADTTRIKDSLSRYYLNKVKIEQ